MSNKLLSAIEDDVFLSEGSVPIVIEGLEHSYDEKDHLPDESMHNSHELLYLREGKVELVLGNEAIMLTKGSVVVIRPLVRHKLLIRSACGGNTIGWYLIRGRSRCRCRGRFWWFRTERRFTETPAGRLTAG